jgi:peptidoglycan/xylan/chitin deacetylase (PgdA/CDA1 family)
MPVSRVPVLIALSIVVVLSSSCRLARGMVEADAAVPGERVVALTFDDGPGPDTLALLDVLDRHQVKATFFVTGAQAVRYPHVVDEIARRGHVVGNHTWSHVDLRRSSEQRRFDEIAPLNWFLANRGISTRCVRPPYGSFDQSVVDHIRGRHGLSYTMLWDIDPRDWQNPPAWQITDRVMAALHPGGVVVMHDGPGGRSRTVAAVDAMIPRITAAGYTIRPVCSVTDLSAPAG